MITLWKGFHHQDLANAIGHAWEHDELLILLPPGLDDFSFVEALPAGEIRLGGGWTTPPALPKRRLEPLWETQTTKPCLGVFTSGTASGRPRLILYSRQNILSSIESILSLFDVDRIDSIFCYPQPFHTFGLCLGYVMSMCRGWKLVAHDGRYSNAHHQAWINERSPGKLTLGAPTHFRDLLSTLSKQGDKPAPSYSCIIGGAAVTRELWLRTKGDLLIEAPSVGYGASEASPGLFHLAPGLCPEEDGQIGLPLPGVAMRNWPGHGLEFSGSNLCAAIIDQGLLSFPSTWIVKDDLIPSDRGQWRYQGRLELLLNRGGTKHSIERIEDFLRADLGSEVLCVALPDQRLGEELGILTTTRPGSQAAWLPRLQARFNANFSPRVLTVDALPLNASLKADRRKAQEWIQHSSPPES